MHNKATETSEEVYNIESKRNKETTYVGRGINKVQYFFLKLGQHSPYIPDFGNFWSLLKVLMVSLFICMIYSFTQTHGISEYHLVFAKNIGLFAPYLLTQLFLLYLFAPQINKAKPATAILILLALNFSCVYIISSAFERSLGGVFYDIDATFAKLGISFGLLFFFIIYFDWRERTIHPSNIKAKLSFLQSKMHPHFLFNTLNSIMSLIKSDPDKARKMLGNLSALLRASLKEDDKSSMTTLRDEILLCNKYLEIEKMRLGDRLRIHWNIDEICLDGCIPKLTLQPLIENSILHGIQKLVNGGDIHISITKENRYMVIKIKNPKTKEHHNNLDDESHNNISMDNLSQRLAIFYNEDLTFTIRDWDQSYEVVIKIPHLTDLSYNPFDN